MEFTHSFKLGRQLLHNRLRNWDRAVLFPFSMNSENPSVEVKILHPQLQTFKQPESAAIKQVDHKIIRILEMLQNRIYLISGKDHRDIVRFLRAGDVPVFSEVLFERMPEKKQQRIERLVLGRGRDIALNSKVGEIFLDIGRRQFMRRFIAQKTLKLARLVRIGFQRLPGVAPRFDLRCKSGDGRVPFRRI